MHLLLMHMGSAVSYFADLGWACSRVWESAGYWLIYACLGCDDWGDLALPHDPPIL